MVVPSLLPSPCLGWAREDYASPANGAPQYIITRHARNISTSCCHALTQPTLPTGLYVGKTSSALTLSSSTTTTAALRVRLSSYYYSSIATSASCTSAAVQQLGSAYNATAGNLTVSPQVLAFTSGSAAFTVSGRRAGCYGLNYTVVGSLRGNFTQPRMQVWVCRVTSWRRQAAGPHGYLQNDLVDGDTATLI